MFKMCCFFILVTCSTSLLAEPIDGDDQAFLLDLSKYLGLSSYQKSLLQGDVVHTALLGDEMLPEEISVVGAMLLVKNVSPSMVIETFMDTETFKVVHDIERYGLLNKSKKGEYTFRELSLDSNLDIRRSLKNPSRMFNLSLKETKSLKRLISVRMPNVEKLEGVWRDILKGRLKSFIDHGVKGIQSYTHKGKIKAEPAVQLSSAIKSVGFLKGRFPMFLNAILEPSTVSSANIDQQYFWMIKDIRGKTVWSLNSELRKLKGNSALAADVHFYASRGYYSMLTFVGAVPYGDYSLVFTINHTYTSTILGFAEKLKRRIGRKRLAKALSLHLERVRSVLEKK